MKALAFRELVLGSLFAHPREGGRVVTSAFAGDAELCGSRARKHLAFASSATAFENWRLYFYWLQVRSRSCELNLVCFLTK